MGKLFLIPALIVALSILVFLLFGWIATERRTAHDYLQEIRHGVTGRKWQAAFELSRELARAEGRQDPALSREIADTLMDPKTTDPLIRRYLLLALEEIGDPSTAPAVRSALGDQDVEVRLYAARAAGRLRDRDSVPVLLELLQEEDPGLRKMALFSLGRIGDVAAVEEMRARLEDPVVDVRWNAALSLAMLGDGSGVGTLRKMLDPSYLDRVEGITEDQKIGARINAIQAVHALGDPELRALVEEVSVEDSSLKVRDAALKLLKEWR
jgi:HEAT repeat protein